MREPDEVHGDCGNGCRKCEALDVLEEATLQYLKVIGCTCLALVGVGFHGDGIACVDEFHEPHCGRWMANAN